jgi:hypothetical protein
MKESIPTADPRTAEAKRLISCPWSRGETATQNVFMPDGVVQVIGNPSKLGNVALGQWRVLQEPQGLGTCVCVTAPSGSQNLYLVRRLANWAWLLVSHRSFKSSVPLAPRADWVAAQQESAATLTKREVRLMLEARTKLNMSAHCRE